MDTSGVVLVAFIVIAVIGASAMWALRETRAREAAGRPIIVRWGSLKVSRPEQWAIACLILWIVAFPVYLHARDR